MAKALVFTLFPALSSRSRTDAANGTTLTEKSSSKDGQLHSKDAYDTSYIDRSYQPWTMQTASTHNSRVVVGGGKGGSQEDILGRGSPNEGRIMKTIELSVTDHSDEGSLERRLR